MNNEGQNNAANNKQGSGRGKKNNRGRYYCWTHGWGGHSGTHCLTPAEGHQPKATLYNRMSGSDKNCPTSNSNE